MELTFRYIKCLTTVWLFMLSLNPFSVNSASVTEIGSLDLGQQLNISLSPNATYLLGWNKSVLKVWSVETGGEIWSISTRSLSAADFSPDESAVIIGDLNGNISILSGKDGTSLSTFSLDGHEATHLGMSQDNQYIYAANGSQTVIQVWNILDPTITYRIGGLDSSLKLRSSFIDIEFSAHQTELLIAKRNRGVSSLDLLTGKLIEKKPSSGRNTPYGYSYSKGDILSPTGNLFVSPGSSRVWNFNDRGWSLDLEESELGDIIFFSQDDQKLVRWSQHPQTLTEWSIQDGVINQSVTSEEKVIDGVFDDSGELYYVTSSFNHIHIKSLSEQVIKQTIPVKLRKTITSASLAIESSKGALGMDSGGTLVWDYSRGTTHILPRIGLDILPATHVELSSSGNQCLVSTKSSVALWEIDTQRLYFSKFYDTEVLNVSFNKNDTEWMIAHGETVSIWSKINEKPTEVQTIKTGHIATAVISPDGTKLLTSDSSGIDILWNVKSGNIKRFFHPHPLPFNLFQAWAGFSPNSKWAIVSPIIGETHLQQTEEEYHRFLLPHEATPSSRFAFTIDGLRLATCYQRVIYLWRLFDRTELGHWLLEGGTKPLSMTFTPDGNQLLVLTDNASLFSIDTPVPQKTSQTISFPTQKDAFTNHPPRKLKSFTTSELPVQYTLIEGPAVLNKDVLNFTGEAGTVILRADQSGNALWHPANPVTRSFTVHPSPTVPTRIRIQPQSRTIIPGRSVSFFVDIESSTPYEIQWFKDDNPIEGANEAVCFIHLAGTLDAGTYHAEIRTPNQILTTQSALLTIGPNQPGSFSCGMDPAPTIAHATFTPDGKWAALVDRSSSDVKLYDPVSGQMIAHISQQAYESLDYTSDGKIPATFHANGTINTPYTTRDRLYSISKGDMWGANLHRFPGFQKIAILGSGFGPVTGVMETPDETGIFTIQNYTWWDKENGWGVHLWRITDGTLRQSFDLHTDSITEMAVTPDGSQLLTLGFMGTAKLSNINDGGLLHLLGKVAHKESLANPYQETPLFQNAKWILQRSVSSDGNTIRELWRRPECQQIITMQDTDSTVHAITSKSDLSMIAMSETTEDQLNLISLWSRAPLQLVRILDGHQSAITTLQYSQDGSVLVSGDQLGTTMIWKGDAVTSLPTTFDSSSTIALSHDGTMMFIGNGKQGQIWNLVDGSLHVTLKGIKEDIRNATFSPDASTLVVVEGKIKLSHWCVKDGEFITTSTSTYASTPDIIQIEFSKSGDQVITTDANYNQLSLKMDSETLSNKPRISIDNSGVLWVKNVSSGTWLSLLFSSQVDDWAEAQVLQKQFVETDSDVSFEVSFSPETDTGYYQVHATTISEE